MDMGEKDRDRGGRIRELSRRTTAWLRPDQADRAAIVRPVVGGLEVDGHEAPSAGGSGMA